MIAIDYDLNVYSDGKSIGLYAYELRYDKDGAVYETNTSKYKTLKFDMADPDNHNVIAFLLKDYSWPEQDWTDFDTWEAPELYTEHPPQVIADFFASLVPYNTEEY